MKTKTYELLSAIKNIKGAKFASLTYRTKEEKNAKGVVVKGGELARYTVILGFNYNTLVEKSLLELQLVVKEQKETWSDLTRLAAANVLRSFRKTLSAHKRGEQNADYTKKEQYVPIGNGLNINSTDTSIQLFGLVQSKTILEEGVRKVVNSKPLTIEQNKLKKDLTISKFREFALDLENIDSARVNGDTIEFVPTLSTLKNVEADLTDKTPVSVPTTV